ncbi:MAG TPA: acetyltransferase [Thermoanaerobaculia bacterium]|nr:acetyltransferase [Thermoanaerobaculia bacterium]
MNTVRGALVLLLLSINLVVWGTIVFVCAMFKFVLTGPPRWRLIAFVSRLADRWVAANNRIFDALLPTEWDLRIAGDLDRDGHYLIFSNHVSWTDIFVVQRLLHRRVAFLRFFIKAELIWLPVVGQVAWALDFPFMRRYTPEYLARHKEKQGKDLETTQRACRRYRRVPAAILNFLEGTRFSRDKHGEQESPYQYLLRPRIGGAGFVLVSLGDQLDGVIDVTICYPGHEVTMRDFVTGRVPRIAARARLLDVPAGFYDPAIVEQGPARERFKGWVEEIWREKDRVVEALL